MAAIAYPSPHAPGVRGTRPALRLVPPSRRARRVTRPAVYRRRRLATLLVSAIVLVPTALWLGGGPLTAPEPRPAAPVPIASSLYIVQPGDTLWTLARRAQPTGDVRPLVDRLAAAQGRRALRAGQRIVLPN
jgi:hypothetical protein